MHTPNRGNTFINHSIYAYSQVVRARLGRTPPVQRHLRDHEHQHESPHHLGQTPTRRRHWCAHGIGEEIACSKACPAWAFLNINEKWETEWLGICPIATRKAMPWHEHPNQPSCLWGWYSHSQVSHARENVPYRANLFTPYSSTPGVWMATNNTPKMAPRNCRTM